MGNCVRKGSESKAAVFLEPTAARGAGDCDSAWAHRSSQLPRFSHRDEELGVEVWLKQGVLILVPALATLLTRASLETCVLVKNLYSREFPGGPLVRTPCFHCRGPGFDPSSGS